MNFTNVSSSHQDGPPDTRTVFFFKPVGAKRARRFSFVKAYFKPSETNPIPHIAVLLLEESENAEWKNPYLLTSSPPASGSGKQAETCCRIRLFPAFKALPDKYALNRKAARILVESGLAKPLALSDAPGEELFDINADAIPTIKPDRLTGIIKEFLTV